MSVGLIEKIENEFSGRIKTTYIKFCRMKNRINHINCDIRKSLMQPNRI